MNEVAPIPSAANLMRQILWPAAMALTAFMAFGVLLLSSAVGQPGEPGLLIFPPNWDRHKVMDAALSINAPLIDIGPAAFVVSVFLEDHATISRAHQAGALFVLNAKTAALCGAK
ncbi:hypothetical protein [Rhodobacteraceae bacterium DSL-40]|uniref:hypothetical protein n=1 Tax=Amaricoccus sp. B4 TaxID=3368557 RepID=UPI0013A6EB69